MHSLFSGIHNLRVLCSYRPNVTRGLWSITPDYGKNRYKDSVSVCFLCLLLCLCVRTHATIATIRFDFLDKDHELISSLNVGYSWGEEDSYIFMSWDFLAPPALPTAPPLLSITRTLSLASRRLKISPTSLGAPKKRKKTSRWTS